MATYEGLGNRSPPPGVSKKKKPRCGFFLKRSPRRKEMKEQSVIATRIDYAAGPGKGIKGGACVCENCFVFTSSPSYCRLLLPVTAAPCHPPSRREAKVRHDFGEVTVAIHGSWATVRLPQRGKVDLQA